MLYQLVTDIRPELKKTFGTFEHLKPAIDGIAKPSSDEHNLLSLAVKTALLAQLSHTPFLDANRGLDAAITVENLFRLDRADIKAINDTAGMIKVERLLVALAKSEPSVVMLEGTGAGARVRIELDAIDLTELLEILRPGPLFGTLLSQVKLALNLTAMSGQEGRLNADSRHTNRNGCIRFESFEQFTASGKNSTLALEPATISRSAFCSRANSPQVRSPQWTTLAPRSNPRVTKARHGRLPGCRHRLRKMPKTRS